MKKLEKKVMKIESLPLSVVSDALSFIDSDDVIFEEGIFRINRDVVICALDDMGIKWDIDNPEHITIVKKALANLVG